MRSPLPACIASLDVVPFARHREEASCFGKVPFIHNFIPCICRIPEIKSVFLNMPNLHFLPCNPVTSKFEDDVYVATSEPHGNIEAVITRGQVQPHCRL